MSKHKYSTIALIFLMSVMIIAILATGIDSSELDEICSTDGKILKRVAGFWICADDNSGTSSTTAIGDATYLREPMCEDNCGTYIEGSGYD